MKTVLVCCETIRREIETALGRLKCDMPVIWIESGLHNVPEKLRARLQQVLDDVDADTGRVLLGFGFCGNAMVGLQSRGLELVIPRVDDCITLMLGNLERRRQYGKTYFMTRGWLDGEQNIWNEYQYTIKKYGEERGRKIYDMMLGQYETLGVLDTGAYDLDALLEETRGIAEKLGLQHQVLPASVDYICQLLGGPWPAERFLVVPPHAAVAHEDVWLER